MVWALAWLLLKESSLPETIRRGKRTSKAVRIAIGYPVYPRQTVIQVLRQLETSKACPADSTYQVVHESIGTHYHNIPFAYSDIVSLGVLHGFVAGVGAEL